MKSMRFMVAFFLAGCSVGAQRFDEIMMEQTQQRAQFDFQCRDVGVQKVAPKSYGALGCDQRAVYVVASIDCNGWRREGFLRSYCMPVLNSDSEPELKK